MMKNSPAFIARINAEYDRVFGDSPPTNLIVRIEKLKRDKLLDILRRCIANPGNVTEVSNEIAKDWFPLMRVSADGSCEIVVGSGKFQ